MTALLILLLLLTAIMLAIHLSIWKLLDIWRESEAKLFNRLLSPRTVIRFEVFFWLLVLLVATIQEWSSWYSIIPIFLILHLGVWLAAEFKNDKRLPLALSRGPMKAAAVVFDLVESIFLVAIAWQSLQSLSAAVA